MARLSPDEFRDLTSAAAAAVRGMVRRVAIGALTSSRLWSALGYEVAPGQRETFDKVPVFQGIGFVARPRSGRGEAIILNIGGRAGHPVIAATKDTANEPTDLDEDETSVHTSTLELRLTAAGTIEAKDRSGGAAVQLATLADLQAMKAAFDAHTHVYSPGPSPAAPTAPPAAPAPAPTGTQVFKAQ